MSTHPDTELLTRAADRIRATVQNLPPGHDTRWIATTLKPNEHRPEYTWWVETDPPPGPGTYATLAECEWARADADHMALWDPVSALLVADLLEQGAVTGQPADPALRALALKLTGQDRRKQA